MTDPSFLRTAEVAYDAVAGTYAQGSRAGLDGRPLDRGLLAAFAELVRSDGAAPVADLGCGPGHVAAFLHRLGLGVFGVDLSPAMVAVARQAYSDLRFEQGSMTALDVADGELGGILAWYSIIHIPTERLPELFAEFHRVLKSGGYLLLAFQIGDQPLRLSHAFGHDVSLVA
jgi:SAM-dependent methyltransferase